jgi:hypothetical protein
MTFRIDWFGLAEGAAADSRGALTLVGFNPLVQVHPALPVTVGFVLVLCLADSDKTSDDDPAALLPGRTLDLDLQIIDPNGARIIGMQQGNDLMAKKYPDLPATVTLALAVSVTFKIHGRYLVRAKVELGGHSVSAEREFYVLQE